MATSVISAATATGAASYSPGYSTAVTAGDTILVGVCTVGTGITITGVSDSAGNTFTQIAHTNNGASGNDCWIGIKSGASAATTSDTLTVSCSGGSFTSITVRADTFAGALSVIGSPSVTSTPSGTVQTLTTATTTATEQIWAWNQQFTSTSAISGSDYVVVDVTFTKTANRRNSTSSNAACSGWAAPGAATATCTSQFTWDANHTGNAILVVLDTSTLSLTGKRGATAQATARYGTLTTANATISSIAGKKTVLAQGSARFGQLTVDYLNDGGIGLVDARFGVLDIAAATTPIAGVKGATALGVTRFGALTTNTLGNLFIAGRKSAVGSGESRFGLISVIGVEITPVLTLSALADARAGFLLLHNRTPGVVTVRAENKGLVTIRIGS